MRGGKVGWPRSRSRTVPALLKLGEAEGGEEERRAETTARSFSFSEKEAKEGIEDDEEEEEQGSEEDEDDAKESNEEKLEEAFELEDSKKTNTGR